MASSSSMDSILARLAHLEKKDEANTKEIRKLKRENVNLKTGNLDLEKKCLDLEQDQAKTLKRVKWMSQSDKLSGADSSGNENSMADKLEHLQKEVEILRGLQKVLNGLLVKHPDAGLKKSLEALKERIIRLDNRNDAMYSKVDEADDKMVALYDKVEEIREKAKVVHDRIDDLERPCRDTRTGPDEYCSDSESDNDTGGYESDDSTFSEDRRMELMKRSQCTNLYVKNLDAKIDDERLRQEFSQFGTITSAKVMLKDGYPRVSKGFGFVNFSSPKAATKALTEMHGRIIEAKPLYVAQAQRKEDRRAHLASQHLQGLASMRQQTVPYGPLFKSGGGYFVPTMPQPQRGFFAPANVGSIRPSTRTPWTPGVRPNQAAD